MGLKLTLNVLYTIGIFICMAAAYWGYQHTRLEVIMGAAFLGLMVLILKIKLLKDLRAPKK